MSKSSNKQREKQLKNWLDNEIHKGSSKRNIKTKYLNNRNL